MSTPIADELIAMESVERRACHEGYDQDRCYDEGGMGQTSCEDSGRMCQRDGTYLITYRVSPVEDTP